MTTDLATVPELRESLELSGRDREAAEAVASGLRDAKAENTRRSYASAWRRFQVWADAGGHPALPATPQAVALYLGHLAAVGRSMATIVPAGKRTDGLGRVHHLRAFQFDGSECMTCPLRSQCISAKGRKGRWVLIHPQEALLQQARALQQSAGCDEYRARRVVLEHRLARLAHWGIRQSRYFGLAKTKFQLYLAATVANLTLVAGKLGRSGRACGGPSGHSVVPNILPSVVANATASFSAVRLGLLWPMILLTSALLPKCLYPTGTFRPGF